MSEEARRTLRYVESLSEARTMLAGFFSILLDRMFHSLSGASEYSAYATSHDDGIRSTDCTPPTDLILAQRRQEFAQGQYLRPCPHYHEGSSRKGGVRVTSVKSETRAFPASLARLA